MKTNLSVDESIYSLDPLDQSILPLVHAHTIHYAFTKARDLPSRKLALMTSPTNIVVPRKAFHAGTQGKYADEWPAANILHHLHNCKDDPKYMYLNYVPTELELGMMWRAEVAEVFYLDPTAENKVISCTRDQNGINEPVIQTQISELFNTFLEGQNKKFSATVQDELILSLLTKLDAAMENIISSRPVEQEVLDMLSQGLEADDANLNLQEPLINEEWSEEERIEYVNQQKKNEGWTDEDIKQLWEQYTVDELMPTEKMNQELNQKINDVEFIRIVMQLIDRSWNIKDSFEKSLGRVAAGRNIGAVLVSKDNKILGWGLNYKSKNKTFHAETLMILRYLRANNVSTLPEGAKIYTSLQCCHMCAGHIATLGKNISVIYAQEDSYFKGKNALRRNLNDNTEKKTTLHHADFFAEAMGDQEITSFLADEIPIQNPVDSSDCSSAGSTSSTKSIASSTERNRKLLAKVYRDAQVLNDLKIRFFLQGGMTLKPISRILAYGQKFLSKLNKATLNQMSRTAPPTPSSSYASLTALLSEEDISRNFSKMNSFSSSLSDLSDDDLDASAIGYEFDVEPFNTAPSSAYRENVKQAARAILTAESSDDEESNSYQYSSLS